MKHNSANRPLHSTRIPVAWRDAAYVALRSNDADTCDDRVSEDIFDVDGECAEVEIVVRSLRSTD